MQQRAYYHNLKWTLFKSKMSSSSLWEKICRQKLHKNVAGKFREIRTKNLRTPKNLSPTAMTENAWVHNQQAWRIVAKGLQWILLNTAMIYFHSKQF